MDIPLQKKKESSWRPGLKNGSEEDKEFGKKRVNLKESESVAVLIKEIPADEWVIIWGNEKRMEVILRSERNKLSYQEREKLQRMSPPTAIIHPLIDLFARFKIPLTACNIKAMLESFSGDPRKTLKEKMDIETRLRRDSSLNGRIEQIVRSDSNDLPFRAKDGDMLSAFGKDGGQFSLGVVRSFVGYAGANKFYSFTRRGIIRLGSQRNIDGGKKFYNEIEEHLIIRIFARLLGGYKLLPESAIHGTVIPDFIVAIKDVSVAWTEDNRTIGLLKLIFDEYKKGRVPEHYFASNIAHEWATLLLGHHRFL